MLAVRLSVRPYERVPVVLLFCHVMLKTGNDGFIELFGLCHPMWLLVGYHEMFSIMKAAYCSEPFTRKLSFSVRKEMRREVAQHCQLVEEDIRNMR